MSSVAGSFSNSPSDREDSTHDGSTNPRPCYNKGRANMSHPLAPLQINTNSSSSNGGEEAAAMRPAMDSKRKPLSLKSEKFIAGRAEELSQLDSPQLRELASKLGNMLNIQTPKYKPEHRLPRPPHLQVNIRHRWQVLQGCNDWKGKLDPIDRDLKAEIIRYGEFAHATYDAFDRKRDSPTCGDSLFDKESLLESVGLINRGYEVTNYIYAPTNHLHNYFSSLKRNGSASSSGSSVGSNHSEHTSRHSSWIGFVALCTSPEEIFRLGRRDIVIAWRGTCTVSDWIADLSDYMSPAGFGRDDDCSHIRVQAGFYKVYTSTCPESRHNRTSSASDQVMKAVKTLVEKYKVQDKLSITITGHSLGSALATLCAYDIAESKFNLLENPPSALSPWSSGGPRACAESEEDSDRIRQPNTGAVRNFLHSKLRHINEDGHRLKIIQDVRKIDGHEESEVHQFRQGRIPVTVYSFAGPRVGNRNFRDRIEQLGVPVLRIVNVHDLVPALPGLKHYARAAEALHNIIPRLPSYKHVGVKLELDSSKSVFLKPHAELPEAHSLDVYLHLVDVYLARNHYAGPSDQTFTDCALVNRSLDFLKPDFYIPPRWKDCKEVARDSNGNWLFPGRDFDERIPKEEDEFADFWQKIDAKSHSANAFPHCL